MNDLRNKKINFLGDSITEGACASSPSKNFVSLIGSEYGAIVRNYGIGGTRIARQIVPTDERWDRDFCGRYTEMDDDADYVVVFGGTNDYGHGDAPIGTPADRTPDTFYGACHYLFRGLIEKYPAIPIAVLTPIRRENEDSPYGDGRKTTPCPPLSRYVEIIREVAACYSLPVLDLWNAGGILPNIPAQKAALTADGLHPNDAGYAYLARRVANFLETL